MSDKTNEIRHRRHFSSASEDFEGIELPPYSKHPNIEVSPISTGRDGDFLSSQEETERTYPEAAHTSKILATSPDFTSLIVNNDRLCNLSICHPGSSNPVFYITNTSFSRTKPSVVLSSRRREGPTLGVLNLLWSRDNVFSITANHDDPTSVWESMRRTSKWTHATYEFQWERRVYVWQRTRMAWYADQPDMDLLDENGKVLAVYKGEQRWASTRRGQFYLRRRDCNEEDEEFGDWEKVVLLTACGIIEASRRRARQRKHG